MSEYLESKDGFYYKEFTNWNANIPTYENRKMTIYNSCELDNFYFHDYLLLAHHKNIVAGSTLFFKRDTIKELFEHLDDNKNPILRYRRGRYRIFLNNDAYVHMMLFL